ncbi:MAG: aldo/keto reductase [Syntrophomonadaceae bacterium]|nr:aldo/keto reductase [Syntrophomonadaceae bacterium]
MKMQQRPLGTSGLSASVIALGTYAIGGWRWGGTDEDESIRTIHAALDAGINFIDTAPVYGLGLSEEIVGKAVKGKRDKVIIATKCGLVWHTQQGVYFIDEYGNPVHKYLGPESVRYEVEQSLRRLQTDYIDLYQTHWQDVTTPIEDTMAELVRLKEEGKIRAIGVSNATVEEMERYCKLGAIDSDQEKYSMLDRQLEETNLPWCLKNQVAFLAYSPLAQGLLTGKIGPDRVFSDDDSRSTNPRYSVENRIKIRSLLDGIQPYADKYALTLGQMVIAWTLAQPGVTHALVGARTPEQAIENATAGKVEVDPDDLQVINTLVRNFSL